MSQTSVILGSVILYVLTSSIAAGLFTHVWIVTHRDREVVQEPESGNSSENISAWWLSDAIRNDIVAGGAACISYLQVVAGLLGAVWFFDLGYFPWQPGLVSVPVLVIANTLGILVAVAILQGRKRMDFRAE